MMKDQIIEEQKGGESFPCLSFDLIVYFQKKNILYSSRRNRDTLPRNKLLCQLFGGHR